MTPSVQQTTCKRPFQLLRILIILAILLPGQVQAGDWMQQAEGILGQFQQVQGITSGHAARGLSDSDIIAGLKQALQKGTATVVRRLSLRDAFAADRHIHIPLPRQLEQARSALATIGMSRSLDELETRINRAAEQATPKAKKLLMNSIRHMSLRDARRILHGPDDAATQYFRRTMTPNLRKAIAPLMQRMLNQTGAVQSYDRLTAGYRHMPFMPDLKADLNKHAVDGTLKGIFYYLAKEEAAIRKDPAKQTTALLRRVFAR